MPTCPSILAWKIPWTEEPGGLQSMGLQRLGHNLVGIRTCTHVHARARAHTHTHTHVFGTPVRGSIGLSMATENVMMNKS